MKVRHMAATRADDGTVRVEFLSDGGTSGAGALVRLDFTGTDAAALGHVLTTLSPYGTTDTREMRQRVDVLTRALAIFDVEG